MFLINTLVVRLGSSKIFQFWRGTCHLGLIIYRTLNVKQPWPQVFRISVVYNDVIKMAAVPLIEIGSGTRSLKPNNGDPAFSWLTATSWWCHYRPLRPLKLGILAVLNSGLITYYHHPKWHVPPQNWNIIPLYSNNTTPL